MLGFFVVPIGTGGELRCTACTTADAVEQRPLAEIEADLDAIALQGDDLNVIFVGMEPFRHAELPQIIGSARARGFDRIKLRTDAGALADEANAAGAFSAGLRQIEVQVLGPPDLHDRLARRPGLWELASRGMEAFRAVGEAAGSDTLVAARLPLCRHNLRHAHEAVASAAQAGAVAVEIVADGLEPTSQHAAFVSAALETATVNRCAGFVTGWSAEKDFGSRAYDLRPWAPLQVTR